jgi:hypothetical protein
MRPFPAVLMGLAVLALVLSSFGGRGDISDPGAPRYANHIMIDFVTPTVAPGETLTFSFKVNNTYVNESAVMADIHLTVGIYMYATKDESREVNDSFPHPPLIYGGSPEYTQILPSMLAGTSQPVSLEIETSRKTPHGTYYSQSSYFLRFNLSFNFQGNSTPIVLKSRGFFTDGEWGKMVTYVNNGMVLNVTYMHSLGVDGIIPDSSFGLKEPIPKWPLVLLGIATGGAAVMALYYFVLDSPGKYPFLEKRFYYLRGKLGELGRKLKDRRRK